MVHYFIAGVGYLIQKQRLAPTAMFLIVTVMVDGVNGGVHSRICCLVASHRDDAGGDGAVPSHRDVIGFSKIICIDL